MVNKSLPSVFVIVSESCEIKFMFQIENFISNA